MIYEIPPILQGSAEEQLQQIRDYLVRLAAAPESGGGSTVIMARTSSSGNRRTGAATDASAQKNIAEVRAYAERLKSLIIKNADQTQQKLDEFEGRIEGIDGLFFYIRYAPVESPTAAQMTIEPQDDTAYMGVCSTNEETAPTAPEAYTWSRILGRNALSLQIVSSNGNIFKNGDISTILAVKVWSGEEDVTDLFDNNDFQWSRISDDAAGDEAWNSAHFGGTKTITVTTADVRGRATFFCELRDMEE